MRLLGGLVVKVNVVAVGLGDLGSRAVVRGGTLRSMSEIKLLDGRDQSGNPLTVLVAGLAELLVPLQELAKNTRPGQHIYVLSSAGEAADGWGVYCLACSAREQDYVWPCSLKVAGELVPPQFFTFSPPPKD
jgi:hypothetical protein